MNKVIIYTDGACSGNPGPGGWAAILQSPGLWVCGHCSELKTGTKEGLCPKCGRFEVMGAMSKIYEIEISGYERQTTNNRMELMAAIKGLSALKRPSEVLIHTDSEYVRKGITEWVHSWRSQGWRNSQKRPVENKDLWELLLYCTEQLGHKIEWMRVEGHSGDPLNTRCDKLAVAASKGMVKS